MVEVSNDRIDKQGSGVSGLLPTTIELICVFFSSTCGVDIRSFNLLVDTFNRRYFDVFHFVVWLARENGGSL